MVLSVLPIAVVLVVASPPPVRTAATPTDTYERALADFNAQRSRPDDGFSEAVMPVVRLAFTRASEACRRSRRLQPSLHFLLRVSTDGRITAVHVQPVTSFSKCVAAALKEVKPPEAPRLESVLRLDWSLAE
jgi:hypothetical protein